MTNRMHLTVFFLAIIATTMQYKLFPINPDVCGLTLYQTKQFGVCFNYAIPGGELKRTFDEVHKCMEEEFGVEDYGHFFFYFECRGGETLNPQLETCLNRYNQVSAFNSCNYRFSTNGWLKTHCAESPSLLQTIEYTYLAVK